MAGIVVLDAGVLIALHSSEDPHHKWALQMFSDTISFELAMSALTYSEALVHPTKAGKELQFEKSVKGLGIEIKGIGPDEAREIASQRVRSGLKMPDAVVLALAARLKGSIATSDKALAAAARRMSIGVFQPD